MNRITLVVLCVSLLGAATAHAQEAAAVEESGPVAERARTGIVVAPKLGIGFGKVLSDFGNSPVFELELGWVVLPFPDLQIFTSLQYARPRQSGSGTDDRLPGEGTWSYEVLEQQLILTPGLLYRVPLGGDRFRPYVAAGPRFYFDKATITGDTGGEPFGTYVETGTAVGGYGALGGDLFLGPGSLLFEVQLGAASIDRYVLRETTAGSLNLALGYRFFF